MVLGFKRKADDGWQGVLRAALGGNGDHIVRFVECGRRPPLPPLEPRTQEWASTQGAALLQQMAVSRQDDGWRRALMGSSLDWLDASRTMPPDARQRFALLLGVTHWSGHAVAGNDWLAFAMRDLSSPQPRLTFARVENAGAWLGFTRDDIIAAVFVPQYARFAGSAKGADLADWSATHRDAIVAALQPQLAKRPELWSRAELGGPAVLRPLLDALAAAVSSTAKTTRAAARGAAVALGFDVLEPELRRIARDGAPGNRAAAVVAMTELAPAERSADVRDWIVEHCADDRAASVRDAVARVVGRGPDEQASGTVVDLPVVDMDVPLPAAFQRHIEHLADRASHQKADVLGVAAVLTGGQTRSGRWGVRVVADKAAPLETLAPVHLARLIIHCTDRGTAWLPPAVAARVVLPSPLELQAVASADRLEPDAALRTIVNVLASNRGAWDDPAVEAWTLHQLPHLVSMLDHQSDDYMFRREGMFRAFATVRSRPETLTRALVQCGLSGLKVDQPLARAVLGADATPHVVAALSSTRSAERRGAANWLRELRDPGTEAPLRAAIAREQHDPSLSEMLRALEAIDASLDEYLSPDRILAQAVAALAKKNAVPPSMQWLSFESLPAVHWKDGGVVDPRIFQWFAATAVRAKSVEPSSLLRRLAEQMRVDEAQRFALALYDTWVAKDLAVRSREQAEAAALDKAKWSVQWAAKYPNEPMYERFKGLTVEQAAVLHLPAELTVIAGSATDSKGVLALCAALGGPDLASRTLAYLKKWRGQRVHQGMAMLGMLAGTEQPAAIQVVLTVSQRFRPKGLQDEATRQVQGLADRRGWTLDDLADRTVPRGGFDDDGKLVLDYGDRSFVAHLRDDLTIDLESVETGKMVKALPDARQDEDAAEVKALQNDLKLARKEVKATASLQPERLYMAMCTERRWPADDFRRYLLDHPILRRLAARLVWLAVDNEGATPRAFRPLTDGTLLDLDDEEVELGEGDTVQVAHEIHLGAEAGARWLDHFRDYKISPLFAQFGRPTPPAADGSSWTAMEGHMISAKALRGAITKAGWQLGAAQDGGIVGWVERDCAMAGLTAVLEITGVPAYTDDSVTALLTAFFVPRGRVGYGASAVPFAEVPPILRLETYGELLQIAAAGTGFDPDYKKKASF